jgi:hypothetical protein
LLITATADYKVTQSVNVGDTNTYTLIAYAYTDGSAVTTTDLDLWLELAEVTTTFADQGSGWYKLTGTLTGAASAKKYGVRVHSGKTVYVDALSLVSTVGVPTTFSLLNSESGTASQTTRRAGRQ